jgi:hypothetical protein
MTQKVEDMEFKINNKEAFDKVVEILLSGESVADKKKQLSALAESLGIDLAAESISNWLGMTIVYDVCDEYTDLADFIDGEETLVEDIRELSSATGLSFDVLNEDIIFGAGPEPITLAGGCYNGGITAYCYDQLLDYRLANR